MIRIGVIGAGPNGRGNCRKFAENHGDRCTVVAVADVNAEAGRELAGTYGAKAVVLPEEMFDDVDAVAVSSPNFLHCEHAIAAARAGKHVWVEKPMALSVVEADRIVEAVNEAGVHSIVGFSVRFGGVERTLAAQYKEGKLGELLSIWSRRVAGFGKDRSQSWRGAFAMSGGVISELIAHEIDWMVDIAGIPQTVYCRKASQVHDDPRANDHVWLMLGYEGEKTGTIEGSQMGTIADYYRGIAGRKASAYTRKWGGEAWLQTGPKEDTQLETLPPLDKHGHFLDVIEGKCESYAPVAWGREIVRITEKALDSAASGGVVGLE